MRAIRTTTISILAIGLLAGSAVGVTAQDEDSVAEQDPQGKAWEHQWLPLDFTGFLFMGPDETGDDDDDRFAKKGKGKVESMLLGVEFLDGSIVGPARFHTLHSKKAGTTWTITTPTHEWTGEPVEAETRGLVTVVPSPHVLQGVNGTEGDLTFDMLTVQSRYDLIVSPVEADTAK